MEAPKYLQHGQQLYMINQNIIINLDLSAYEHGLINCSTADARTGLIEAHPDAKPLEPAHFHKHLQQFLAFVFTANQNIPLNTILEANTPNSLDAGPLDGPAERLKNDCHADIQE